MAKSPMYSCGALLAGCLFLVTLQIVSGQTQAPKPDELKFNGNSADQQQQHQQDTTIIDNNSRPLNGQQQPDTLEGNFYEDPNSPRPGPLPWPFTPSFGFGVAPPSRGQSLWHQLMGGPGRLFDRLDRPMRHMEHMSRNFEQQFRELERQASMGEGQDVSYFQRNGVAYVRTCTTKRVMPNGQSDQKQLEMGPVSSTTVLPGNDQQGQQQPELQNKQQQQQQDYLSDMSGMSSTSLAPNA